MYKIVSCKEINEYFILANSHSTLHFLDEIEHITSVGCVDGDQMWEKTWTTRTFVAEKSVIMSL